MKSGNKNIGVSLAPRPRYRVAYIEGCNVTFPQTQTILDGAIINNVAVSDIQTVLNLRDGWKFILSHIEDALNLNYLCKVNEFVSRNESLEWGVLRTGSVDISGTDYKPSVPDQETVTRELEELKKIKDPVDYALHLFCYVVKNQLFWDGNKGTATMVTNKALIQTGKGVPTIDSRHAEEFNESLMHFYNTDDKTPLLTCLRKRIKTLERTVSKSDAGQRHNKDDQER